MVGAHVTEVVPRFVKKVAVIGDSGVGKKAICTRFSDSVFSPEYVGVIGTRVSKRVVNVQVTDSYKPSVALMLWDITARAPDVLHRAYNREADGALIVGDATRPETIDSLLAWYNVLEKPECRGFSAVYGANKIDLVPPEAREGVGRRLAAAVGNNPYYLMSAKTGEGVEQAFQTLADQMMKATMEHFFRREGVEASP